MASLPSLVPFPADPARPSGSDASGSAGPWAINRILELEREVELLRLALQAREQAAAALTAAQEAQATVERNRQIFFANVSHEIRTVTGGILGLGNLLLDSSLDEDQQAMVQTVCRAGEGMLGLLNDLLDFSKLETGCFTLESRDFNLRDELRFAVELHAPAAMQKGLKLILDMDPHLPGNVCGDALRLRQVVLNLIGNAVKFTERGEVGLRVWYERKAADRGMLRCEVSDTGMGISSEAQAGLFQPFVQADCSTARCFGGTGLGLAICKRLTGLMGGSIGVRSTPGVGSTFWFGVELAEVLSASAPPEPENVRLQGRTVLIVESNPTQRHRLERVCTEWGMRCEVANTAAMALAQLRWGGPNRTPFDLVVFNHRLPDAEDGELVLAIRRDPRLPAPALVMLASREILMLERVWSARGVAVCGSAPIFADKLQLAMRRALTRASIVHADAGCDCARGRRPEGTV